MCLGYLFIKLEYCTCGLCHWCSYCRGTGRRWILFRLFHFSLRVVLFRGWEDGGGEEEAGGAESLRCPWNSPLSPFIRRGIRPRGRTSLLVSFSSQRFFQQSRIPAAAGAGRRAAAFAFLMPFDNAAKNLARSRRCRPAGRRLVSEAVNLASRRWRNLSEFCRTAQGTVLPASR